MNSATNNETKSRFPCCKYAIKIPNAATITEKVTNRHDQEQQRGAMSFLWWLTILGLGTAISTSWLCPGSEFHSHCGWRLYLYSPHCTSLVSYKRQHRTTQINRLIPTYNLSIFILHTSYFTF